jgi:hypothetical protein
MMTRGFTLAVLLAIGFSAIATDAAILCAKKNGLVALRDSTCKKKETQVDPIALGLQGPQGPQGPQGLQGPAGADGTARAFGEVEIDAMGNYALVAGTTRNVVGLTQGGGGNPAACIELDPSIDAATAIVVAIPNLRSGGITAWDTHVLTARPLGYCNGGNVIEVDTSQTDSPGAASKRAFHFAVM